jgi:hypothetical protein
MKPVIHSSFPLKNIAAAFRALRIANAASLDDPVQSDRCDLQHPRSRLGHDDTALRTFKTMLPG